ncbi:hypothetical protein PIB30_083967 [Stylosanthes scabra]|uniref:Uncharacterized protein n=1 Tax=Stylosanthes scabra TaxID=79078 RepID=A0ABU6YRG7_9FABA|nr:hypothetical protein [Stylosanthes scabra]
MGERLTPKQIGGASTAFDNQSARFPELNANLELNSGLINLLPKFHGRPGKMNKESLRSKKQSFEALKQRAPRLGVELGA